MFIVITWITSQVLKNMFLNWHCISVSCKVWLDFFNYHKEPQLSPFAIIWLVIILIIDYRAKSAPDPIHGREDQSVVDGGRRPYLSCLQRRVGGRATTWGQNTAGHTACRMCQQTHWWKSSLHCWVQVNMGLVWVSISKVFPVGKTAGIFKCVEANVAFIDICM